MNIVYSSKESADIEYKGKKARFSGDLESRGFRAFADSMRWTEPVRDAPVSEEEREEVLKAASEFAVNMKNPIYFVNKNGERLKILDDEIEQNKKQKNILRRLWEKMFRV